MKEYSRGCSSARASSSSPSRAGGRAEGRTPKKKKKVYAFESPPVNRDDTPGPGEYDCDSHSLGKRVLKSHNKHISQGHGCFMTNLDDDRSAPSLTGDGDPTAYSDYHLERASLGACSQQISNRQVRQGRIGFGSRVARCVDASFEDNSEAAKLRGPGAYNSEHLYSCGSMHGAATQSGTTAFTNKAPLCGYVRKIDTPGVGDYRPERIETCSDSKLGSSSFAGTTARCSTDPASSGVGPGPESYELDQHTISRLLDKSNSLLPPFGVSSRRI